MAGWLRRLADFISKPLPADWRNGLAAAMAVTAFGVGAFVFATVEPDPGVTVVRVGDRLYVGDVDRWSSAWSRISPGMLVVW